jgi:hypothetical protein
VTSSPGGIDCGAACSARFAEGTAVTLVPNPVPRTSVFAGWGGACAGSGACTVAVDGPKSVSASFAKATTLTLNPSGTGVGTLTAAGATCTTGAPCPVDVAYGTTVTVSATADASSVFKSWTGCTPTAGDPATCSLGTSYPATVSGRFEPSTLALNANPNGTGAGTISGAGLNCTTGSFDGCNAAVPNPPNTTAYTTVTLTATAAPGSVFKSWTGCIPVTGDPATCTLLVSGMRNVSARFEPSAFPLNASTTGTGIGTISGAGLACTTGSYAGCTASVDNPANSTAYQTVTLTASAAPGSVFKSWSQCTAVPGDPTSCTISMSRASNVSARFEPSTWPLTANPTGTGSGTISGAGLSCTTGSSAGCTAPVDNPANGSAYLTVTVTATPTPGSSFKSWTGCTPVTGDPASCTLSMSGAKTVSARFEPSTWPLTANPTGAGSGTISGAGLSCTTGSGDGCVAAVENPNNSTAYLTVTLKATPSTGSVFKSWVGCTQLPTDPASCTISMSRAGNVSARFEPSTFPLTASATGTGAGTISGAGLSCATGSGDGCFASVENPANATNYNTVTITATPSPGSVFKSWTGCTALTSDPASCSVLMSGARSVSARFEPSTLPLSATATGAGSGTISGAGLSCTTGSPDGCSVPVDNPANTTAYTTVTISAIPSAGSVFKSWSGCYPVPGDPATCTLSMSSAKSVSARFEPSTFPLTATPTGIGSGAISGAGLSCTTGSPDGCAASVENPANSTAYTTVTLTATPAAGSVFKSWSGCYPVPGDPASCTLSMSSAKSVSARFEPSTLPLTVTITGNGTGTVSGAGLACTTGSADGCTAAVPNPPNTMEYTTVTLTTAPAGGSTFKSWSGCTPSPTDPTSCSISVYRASQVSASFSSP